ncbi:hypothetical protein EJB05_20442, partial [Eragrostis curvula]
MPRDGGADEVADLWAMAAELERQFAGYKQRLAERNGRSAHHDDAAACDDVGVCVVGNGGVEEEEVTEPGGGDVRGRMYEAYVRRRDERLRQGWRERMERKEAEVKAFWAQLELSGRAGGNDGVETAVAGDDEERKAERNDDDKKRSSDVALAPRRISGKKHARTRSFSSSTNTGRTSPDAGTRRALSQEPPPSEPQAAGDASKEHPARPAGGAAATTARTTLRPKTTSLRRKNSVKGHGSAKQTGPKLPRALPRRGSSGGLEDLGKEVVVPNADAAGTPLVIRSSEHDLHGQAPKASPLRQFTGDGTGAANEQAASPGSDRSEVVDAVPERELEVNNAEVAKRGDDKESGTSRDDRLGNPNGEVTSDSDIEQSYVYIDKDDVVEKQAMSVPGSLPARDAVPEIRAKTSKQHAQTTTSPPVDATAAEIATTPNAGEAPARESSDDSPFSGRLGRRSAPNGAAPSCSSRDHSIERLLEADAALLRKKREARAEKSSLKTPGSAGSRVSGTGRSPNSKETPRGFKRFLSFGKKNRAREVTVIDCTSPSVSSVADDDSGGCLSAGSIKPRMGSSDAASDDTEHGHTISPRACSLQSLVAASPAKSELAEIVPQLIGRSSHFDRSTADGADSRQEYGIATFL